MENAFGGSAISKYDLSTRDEGKVVSKTKNKHGKTITN